MRISETTQQTIVVYPGRFMPFHKGHASVYKYLKSKYKTVYIATSDKVDPPKSPFNFAEKRAMMLHAGIPADAIVQAKSPYRADEITSRYDPNSTVLIFAISEKDMSENPRFSFEPKKDGSPSYFQPLNDKPETLDKHGYITTVPTLDFTVLGKPMRSATELRRNFTQANEETQVKMIKDLYGSYSKKIHDIMSSRITEVMSITARPDYLGFHKPHSPKKPTFTKKGDLYYGHSVFGGNKGVVVRAYKQLTHVVDGLKKLNTQKPIDKETKKHVLQQIKAIREKLSQLQVESKLAERWESKYKKNVKKKKKAKKKHEVWKRVKEAKNQTMWDFLYKENSGEFWRGIGSTGQGHGLGALGKGVYLSWKEGMAQAFAGDGGEVKQYKVKPGLNIVDVEDKDFIDTKAQMGFQPWEYSGDPMFAGMLTMLLKDKGYDGAISDDVATGIVIFDESNVTQSTNEDIESASPGKLGDCFPVAGRAMLDLEGILETAGYKLVHALVRGEGKLKGRRFGHAFNRLGDVIFDNSNGNKVVMRKEAYFKQGSINLNEKGAYIEYDKEQSLINMAKRLHWGPWDLDESLMEEIPDAPAEVGTKHVSISHNELDKAKNELGLKEFKVEIPEEQLTEVSFNTAWYNVHTNDMLQGETHGEIIADHSDQMGVDYDPDAGDAGVSLAWLEAQENGWVRIVLPGRSLSSSSSNWSFMGEEEYLPLALKEFMPDLYRHMGGLFIDFTDDNSRSVKFILPDEREKFRQWFKSITESSEDGLKEFKVEIPVDKKFNIPRSEMPQVRTDDYPEFLDYLSNAGAVFSKEKVLAKTLKPVQGEFAEKGVIKSLKKRGAVKPVIASSDNYIIDGHHRWLAALNTDQKVLIYRVNMGADELMQLVLDFPETYFKDIYEIATHEVRSKTRSGKRYIDVYLPQGGEEGVMLLRWAGQKDWYKRVELRGASYTNRPEDSNELWDTFDKLYPSKTSALMADEITTIGPGQGVYSYGYDDLLKLMTEEISEELKLKKVDVITKVSNTDPPFYVIRMKDDTWSVWDKNPHSGKDDDDLKAKELSVKHRNIASARNWISLELRRHKKVNENDQANYKPKVFVDMDGVLANFFDEWEKMLSVGDWHDIKDPNEALKALAGTNFFSTLPKFPGKTDELVTFVNGITNGNWYILSAPLRWDREGSAKHKQEWLSKNLPIQPKDAIFDGMKERYAIDKMTGQPNILIDDHSKHIKRWTDKGGIGIQYKAKSDSVEKVKQFLENHLGTMRKDAEIQANENAVGIITKQNTTKDVKPGETQRQAKKLGFKLDKKGRPPLLHKTAAKNSDPNTLFNIGLVN